jgi:DNA-binding GntR family transcriptional regulator
MTTLSHQISEKLAGEIIGGQLAPGRKLDEVSLAARFRVSRSPVRDALRQLAATRLVDYFPRRGFSVAKIDPSGLDDMFEAAAEIEALCAKLCALRSAPADRKRIELIHTQARAAVAKNDTRTYSALNEDLHLAIYAAARNKTLELAALNLRQRLAPFRSRVFFAAANRMRGSFGEHDAIVKAILAHDAEGAMSAMRDHATQAALNVSQYFAHPAGADAGTRARRSGRSAAQRGR